MVVGGMATSTSAAARNGVPVGLNDQPFTNLGPSGVDAVGRGIPSGRVQDVEADPFVNNRVLALSDSAIWISADGGSSWTRSPGLDTFGQWQFGLGSLAFDPAQSGVVLVASPSDDRLPSEGGVYRSTDGGLTWSQPENFRPVCPTGSVGDPAPTRVIFQGHNAYVAAGCVVGSSIDDGASWSWSAPDNGGWFGGVATDVDGNLFACGNNGIFERKPAGWQQVVSFGSSDGWSPMVGSPFVTNAGPVNVSTCRMTASPVMANHVFFTARWQGNNTLSVVFEAYEDAQQSWHWQDLVAPWHPNGRDVVVETQPLYDGFKNTGFNLYWNSTDLWYFQRCTTGQAFECAPGISHSESSNDPHADPPWTRLGYRNGDLRHQLHADAGNILFSPYLPDCVWLVADDGGIERPAGTPSAYNDTCLGTTNDWEYRNRGISALQPYDLSLTSLLGTSNTDVYAAAQDSGGYARINGDSGWRNVDTGNDGYAVAATYAVFPSQARDIHVYYKGDDFQHAGGRGFSDDGYALFNPFSNPASVSPGGRSWSWAGLEHAQQITELPSGRLVIAVRPAGGLGPITAQTALFESGDGRHWDQLLPGGGEFLAGRVAIDGSVGEGGASVIATGTHTQPVLYVGSFGNLYRVDGDAFSSARQLLAGDDVGWFSVADPDHLIAYSCPSTTTCDQGSLKVTGDGGMTWHDLTTIGHLVTNDGFGGFYPESGPPVPGCPNAQCGQIQSVAVEPHQPEVMAVGTRDTGLFESGDAGQSWERVTNLLEPNINNLRFDLSGHLFASSYGRGVLELTPAPDQLHLARQASPLRDRSRWAARARSARGRPLAAVPVMFTLTTDHGLQVPLGTVSTGPDGRASIDFVVPTGLSGVVTMHATASGPVSGPDNRELATEAPF